MKQLISTILLCLVLSIPTICGAGPKYKLDGWDKLLLGGFAAGQLIDGLQTVEAIKNPNYYEKNDLYNQAGKDWVLPIKAAEVGITYFVASRWMPDSLIRKVALIGCNAIVWKYVYDNDSIGIAIKFPY